jgi:hypothetical protein
VTEIFLFGLLLTSPAWMPSIFWALSRQLDFCYRLVGAWVCGIALPTCFGWSIYRNEGGGGDTDPGMFFATAFGASAILSIVVVLALQHLTDRR